MDATGKPRVWVKGKGMWGTVAENCVPPGSVYDVTYCFPTLFDVANGISDSLPAVKLSLI